jgi:hypothetical protein
VAEDWTPVVGVDFPWAEQVMLLPPSALERIPDDDTAELGYPELRSPKLRAVLDRIGRDLGVNIDLTPLPVGTLAGIDDAMTPPEGLEAHRFAGRDRRGAADCSVEGCGKPYRNPIHEWTPPYRLRYLDELDVGDRVWLGDHPRRWDEGTILDKRDGDGLVWLIIVDHDGDQRGINAHRYTTIPVPL